MNYNQLIPQNIIEAGGPFFSAQTVMQAKRVLETARINISFQKGNIDRYFIISGIVNDGEQRRSKVSYKKEAGSVSSTCDCAQWSEEGDRYERRELYPSGSERDSDDRLFRLLVDITWYYPLPTFANSSH